MLSALNQISAITLANLRTIPSRLGISLVIVIGLAGVVAVLTSLMAMSNGLSGTLMATGKKDRVVMLRASSQAELNSVLGREDIDIAKQAAGLARDAAGNAIASAELIVITELLPMGQSKGGINVSLRGVEQAAFTLRPEVRVVAGERFKPGLREVLVGKKAQSQFAGLNLGAVVRFRGAEWKIVGVFESGDAHESELWVDVETAQSSFGRGNSYSTLVAQLQSEASFDALKAALAADPRMKVDLERERSYYSAQTEQSTRGINVLTFFVSLIMGLGAIFAALNTMYSAVSTRTKEIATLRAIGFGGIPVMVSVLAESMLLAFLGGLLGALIAYVMFNGNTISTLGAGFTQVAFSFAVSPNLIAIGLQLSLAIGFIGGFFPALRAASTNIPMALRAG
jgi:putative ABC transport system permease protein